MTPTHKTIAVKFDGIKKRQRTKKFVFQKLLDIPLSEYQLNLEAWTKKAKDYVESNFREYPNQVTLVIDDVEIGDIFRSQMLLGSKNKEQYEVTL